MNHRPLISIIILNHNGIKDTIECLDSDGDCPYKTQPVDSEDAAIELHRAICEKIEELRAKHKDKS